MKKLNIEITKAQIMSYSVQLGENKPSVSATIGLFTDGGKKISDYSISTNSYNEENKFELPLGIVSPIMDIMKELEVIVIKHCKSNQLELTEGE